MKLDELPTLNSVFAKARIESHLKVNSGIVEGALGFGMIEWVLITLPTHNTTTTSTEYDDDSRIKMRRELEEWNKRDLRPRRLIHRPTAQKSLRTRYDFRFGHTHTQQDLDLRRTYKWFSEHDFIHHQMIREQRRERSLLKLSERFSFALFDGFSSLPLVCCCEIDFTYDGSSSKDSFHRWLFSLWVKLCGRYRYMWVKNKETTSSIDLNWMADKKAGVNHWAKLSERKSFFLLMEKTANWLAPIICEDVVSFNEFLFLILSLWGSPPTPKHSKENTENTTKKTSQKGAVKGKNGNRSI